MYICSFFFLVIFYNFLTNYVINPKNELILQDIDHSNYIDKNSDPLYENDKFSLHESNYAQIKLKSIKIISKNFFTGIGYNKFKNFEIEDYDFVFGYMPHSSFFGLIVENGFFAFLIFFFLLTYSIKLNLREKKIFTTSLLYFLIMNQSIWMFIILKYYGLFSFIILWKSIKD